MDWLTGLTIGLHIASVHYPSDEMHDFNPGIYVVTPGGWAAGTYYNSVHRMSVYGGHVWTWGPVSLTGGLIYGYERKPAVCVTVMTASGPAQDCGQPGSGTRWPVAPFLSPSVALPSVLGIVPRISLMPGWFGGSTALHLSLEHTL